MPLDQKPHLMRNVSGIDCFEKFKDENKGVVIKVLATPEISEACQAVPVKNI